MLQNTLSQSSEAALGPVDILCEQCGESFGGQDALEFSELDWDEVMATNLKVPFFLAQAAAQSMVSGKRPGKIINIASFAVTSRRDSCGFLYGE